MAGDRTPGSGELTSAADAAAREATPWVEALARAGYAAKGTVYVLVGGLAVAAAVGGGGQPTGSSGALASLADSSAGRLALGVVAAGLVGYVVWGLVRAAMDPENEGTGHRIFFAVTAIIYALLALEAARLALGSGAGGGGNEAAHWSRQLMQQPFGQWIVGLAGVAIAIYGIHQMINAWQVDLDDQLALGRMSSRSRTWAVRAGRSGLAARGVVFGIIGYYLTRAALRSSPSEARGLEEVLSSMRDTPWLLALIALGLLAYGLYNFVRARYRVIRTALG